jgi:hypothetical protein
MEEPQPRTPRSLWRPAVESAVALATAATVLVAAGADDPIAAEIARLTALVNGKTSTEETWADARQSSQPTLVRAAEALRDGRRWLALYRLSVAREPLVAASYVAERPPEESKDLAAFEAAWTRVGGELRSDLVPPTSDALAGLRPAAMRAFGEAALAQVRGYYESSLEYGQNTMPKYGLYYLGSARAQRELVELLRGMPAPAAPLPSPPLRSLDAELAALEAEVLAAYRPPASIDKHREFIIASSAIKMARELDQGGLRYGALLRYLQAVLRSAPLRTEPPALNPGALRARLRELDARLAAGPFDHSLGRFFLELAEAEGASTDAQGPATAAAVVDRVFPRYFAALEPAGPAPPRPEPTVTVTLVRWPYT